MDATPSPYSGIYRGNLLLFNLSSLSDAGSGFRLHDTDDDYNKEDEPELVRLALTHPEAFRSLYAHYLPRVYGYIASRVDSVQDAEDLTAETFLNVVKSLGQFEYRGTGSFAAWLFRIAFNQVAAFHRRSPPGIHPIDDFASFPSEHPMPEDWLAEQERARRVRAMLTTLAPRRQEIMTLRFYGGLRNKEIAVVLGLDERSVAAHLSRALADLQRRYRTDATLSGEEPQ